MPVKVIFAPEARDEFRDAFEWYGGHGPRFATAIAAAVREIQSHPMRWPVVKRDIRKYRTRTFPYGVLYKVKVDHIRVLAIMHLSREPDYWDRRDEG